MATSRFSYMKQQLWYKGRSDPPFEIQANVSKSNYDYNKHQSLI